jgi:type IV fimbrial biogenesis protein FimT
MWIMPAYQNWIYHSQLEVKAHQLLSSLQFARSVAMQRQVQVTLCKTSDFQACGGTWQNGWIVFAQTEQPQLLQSYPGLLPQQTLIWKGARALEAVQFQPLGMSIGHNGHFVLCGKGSKIAWLIFISRTGRIRLEASRDLSECNPFSL